MCARAFSCATDNGSAIVDGTRVLERDPEHGYLQRISVDADDASGRHLHAVGEARSRMAMPIPGVHGVCWTTLVHWDIDGVDAWGDDQDAWPLHGWAALRRTPTNRDTSMTVTVDIADHIAVVTLDRPPVNAVDHATLGELADAFTGLNEDRDVRVAIFTATGDRAFMAGLDLRAEAPDTDRSATRFVTDPGLVAREPMWAITDCAVPVIGAINGPALGAGLAYAACCDILVAADTATFGTTEINVGLLGASAHLTRLVGRHKAREMFFTGETITADELHRLGVVRAVVPRAQLMDTARALAATLAAKSPIALRLAKESMNRVEDLSLKEGYRTEQDYTARLLRFEDAAEGTRRVPRSTRPRLEMALSS